MSWVSAAIFYHLFPLGCLGAPERNSLGDPPANRLAGLMPWIDHMERLGANALLLGPIFESGSHGYDTIDLFAIDRRLGDEAAMISVSQEIHRRGIRLILDGVFNHTGREFRAFRDVREKGRASEYCDWYHLDFSRRSPFGDPFHYQGWAGHYDLAKLNVNNSAVREHLFAAVSSWIDRFDIDGLRIDAADAIDLDFLHALADHCRARKRDFWLMGEVVHGNYRKWVEQGGLTGATNYQAYKGLWSSHNDRNYFELAYTLKREFGAEGLYRGIPLYNFADNHDVERVASILKEPAHLYPLHILLMTMPGVPSIYYGSEYGTEGRKTKGTDAPLRPALDPETIARTAPHPELFGVVKKLISIRREYPALRDGDYTQLHVSHEQFAFMRNTQAESIVVAVNAASEPSRIVLTIPGIADGRGIDVLNPGESFDIRGGGCAIALSSRWGRVLVFRR
jgi:cyclomaltodextrinase / maltogenic alpha-amylase / neopullulanase